MVPPHVCMVPHVKCLHVLYDSYGPCTLYGIDIIWSPTCTHGPPTCTIWCQWLLWCPHIWYGIGIWCSPLPFMEQVLYGPPTCMMWCSPLPYMEQVSDGPSHMGDMIFSGQLWKGSTAFLNRTNKRSSSRKQSNLLSQTDCTPSLQKYYKTPLGV